MAAATISERDNALVKLKDEVDEVKKLRRLCDGMKAELDAWRDGRPDVTYPNNSWRNDPYISPLIGQSGR